MEEKGKRGKDEGKERREGRKLSIMKRRQPRTTRTDKLLPYTTVFRSAQHPNGLLCLCRRDEAAHSGRGQQGRGTDVAAFGEFDLGCARPAAQCRLSPRRQPNELPFRRNHDRSGRFLQQQARKASDLSMAGLHRRRLWRSEEHKYELQSLMRISY